MSTNLFLFFVPVRGVLQNANALWYQQNFNGIALTFLALAASFYFIPKLLNRPLHSRQLALFAVWTLALFCAWGGLANGAPFPRWMITLSTAGTFLSVIPLLAIAINFVRTVSPNFKFLSTTLTLRFFYAGLMAFFISKTHEIIAAIPSISSKFGFSLLLVAQKELFFWGFLVMTIFGALNYILPRLFRTDWPSRMLVKAQFWCYLTGISIAYVAKLTGGLAQGFGGQNQVLMALRIATVGDLLIFFGVVAFLLNAGGLVRSGFGKMSVATKEIVRAAQQCSPTMLSIVAAVFSVMIISWIGCVVFPILQLERLQQTKTVETGSLHPTPRAGLVKQGAEIYRAQGCIACHTQIIEPGLAPRRTVARDYIFDEPPLLGSLRLGPDLANVGYRQDARTLLAHLYDPKESVTNSVMPSYKYLFDYDQKEALALAAYLSSLKVDGKLYETPK